jgi:23S rRNA G2445 N2-methylase RlmL
MEEVCLQEVKELLNLSGRVHPRLVEVDASPEQALTWLYHGQSLRRLLISLGKYKNLEEADFHSVHWKNVVGTNNSFKVEVENVKGMDNRLALAKQVAGKVFAALEKQDLDLTLDLKKPQFLLLVYFNGQEYFMGLDLAGEELHSRAYRVFTHSASCKGDLGYYFVKKTGYQKGNNLLVGFVKDGVLAIEAALYTTRVPVHAEKNNFSYRHFPLFHAVKYTALPKNENISIAGVDEGLQNITAARKNAQIAGVRKQVNLQKIQLDELSGAFHEHEFDQIIFQVTTKDEDKLNEMYHQVKYLLKPKGRLLLIGRESWQISTPTFCKQVSEEKVERGGNTYKLWLMQKK